jgi:hypothetical protein
MRPRQRVDATTQERYVLKLIRDYLRALPGCYHVRQQQGLGSTPGVPDLIACIRHPHGYGRFVAIEVKGARGKATEAQLQHLDAIRRAGGIAVLARSLDDVIEALREAGYPVASQQGLVLQRRG